MRMFKTITENKFGTFAEAFDSKPSNKKVKVLESKRKTLENKKVKDWCPGDANTIYGAWKGCYPVDSGLYRVCTQDEEGGKVTILPIKLRSKEHAIQCMKGMAFFYDIVWVVKLPTSDAYDEDEFESDPEREGLDQEANPEKYDALPELPEGAYRDRLGNVHYDSSYLH